MAKKSVKKKHKGLHPFKKCKNLKSKIYDQWSKTTKIFFWMSFISILINIFLGSGIYIEINRSTYETNIYEEKPERHLNETTKAEIDMILTGYDKNNIRVGYLSGDYEALRYAIEINDYLKSKGYDAYTCVITLPGTNLIGWTHDFKEYGILEFIIGNNM